MIIIIAKTNRNSASTFTHTHTQTHTDIHTNTHTHKHTHTHTHTHYDQSFPAISPEIIKCLVLGRMLPQLS